MDHISILKELSVQAAVSGNEKEFSNIIKELFSKKCDSVETDKFYNVIGIKKGTSNEDKKIMITAHMDEIGFLVKIIDDKGFIKFTNIGGIDNKILLAQEVIIHGKKEVTGVIGAKPPHLLKPEEAKKAVKLDELTIDTGMDCENVKKYISIGDVITFKVQPFLLQGNKLSSKSIDNRCGIVALLEVMDQLTLIKHKYDVYFIATTQEEVELTGVTTAAYNLNPELAVVIDACHGDMPDSPKESTCGLGKGPAIGIGPNLHKGFTKKLIEIARDENIPYQIDVEPGDSGTEAWAIQVSRSGIPTVLASIPVKYMHTTVETVSVIDIKNTGKLVAKFIISAEMGDSVCC
jgi:tetrahedral aminopeptidase